MRCGVGDYTLRLGRALAELGVTVGLLTSRQAGPDPHVEVLPVMDGWGLANAAAARAAIRRWRPDIVHVQYPTQGYGEGRLPTLLPLIAWLSRARVARTWHEIPELGQAPGFVVQAAPPGPYVVVRPAFLERMPPALRPLLAGRKGGFIRNASSIQRSAASSERLAALKTHYLGGKKRLIAYFGFLYAFKGVDQVFDIANPTTDRLVIAGEPVDFPYFESLQARAETPPWGGSVTFTGFLSDDDTADLLAAADAVVLPFRQGGGVWNSSIHAAVLQGTPVISTSTEQEGEDEARLVHFARPGDVAGMRAALDRLAGRRRPFDPEIDTDEWRHIAQQHLALYTAGERAGGGRS